MQGRRNRGDHGGEVPPLLSAVRSYPTAPHSREPPDAEYAHAQLVMARFVVLLGFVLSLPVCPGHRNYIYVARLPAYYYHIIVAPLKPT